MNQLIIMIKKGFFYQNTKYYLQIKKKLNPAIFCFVELVRIF